MSKKIFRASLVFLLVGTLFFLFPPHFISAFAENTTFQVNVQEVLSVSITTPTNWASGEVDEFLTNKVTLAVTSNHIDGFTATMATSSADTSLAHSSKANTTLPTLESATTRASFPANHWGFSINDSDEGDSTSNYAALTGPSSPITLISNDQSTGSNGEQLATSRNIYFGAKSNLSQASGTYSGTVVFNVVSGIITENNPVTPTNPATPGEDNVATYDQANNRTIYTTTARNTTEGTVEQTTTINQGDATGSYQDPAGVTDSTSSNIYDGSILTTGLAVTASVAAASGIFFFILAKRKKDDDEEETE